jgi:addiction module HigA family antidote
MIPKRKPTHPGELLKEDIIIPLGLTITEAAKDLGISRKHLSQITNGHKPISPEIAIRIAQATETSAESWINMQTKYDLWVAQQKQIKVIPFANKQTNK